MSFVIIKIAFILDHTFVSLHSQHPTPIFHVLPEHTVKRHLTILSVELTLPISLSTVNFTFKFIAILEVQQTFIRLHHIVDKWAKILGAVCEHHLA